MPVDVLGDQLVPQGADVPPCTWEGILADRVVDLRHAFQDLELNLQRQAGHRHFIDVGSSVPFAKRNWSISLWETPSGSTVY